MDFINVGNSTFLPVSFVKEIKFDRTKETQAGKRCAEVTFVDGTSKIYEACPKATEDLFYQKSSLV